MTERRVGGHRTFERRVQSLNAFYCIMAVHGLVGTSKLVLVELLFVLPLGLVEVSPGGTPVRRLDAKLSLDNLLSDGHVVAELTDCANQNPIVQHNNRPSNRGVYVKELWDVGVCNQRLVVFSVTWMVASAIVVGR